ncbi:hypothetical protein L0F63_006714 [Massospora cicadina]|nr:hypothetical protein L0F63_006714 [Massospora cicadina]
MLDPYARYPQPTLFVPTFGQRLRKWVADEGQKFVFIALWVASQLLMFLIGFIKYSYDDNLSQARTTLGITFPIARASAVAIHVDTGIVMLPMCRNTISYLRTTYLAKLVPFDQNVEFHKLVGWSLLGFSLLHTFAHYINFTKFAANDPDGPSWAFYAFVTGPGWTGHLILGALVLIVLTSLGSVRLRCFEAFWYTHHLFAVYFFGFSFHGAFCLVKPDRPPFCKDGGSFYKYWVLSGVLYLVERLLRELRGLRKTTISKVVLHPSNVVEIQMQRGGMKTQAGQWIFLCCPAVSLHQWHPFTLTSAPEEDYISVHVRVVGNFTAALAKALGCDLGAGASSVVKTVFPRVMVDGPFGSASEDVFLYEVAVLIGAGIGVTPFASVLKSIWYRVNYPQAKTRLTKVYFIWICRDKEAFEWFQDLLKAIEEEDIQQFIEIHTYLTGKLKADEAANIILNDQEGHQDAVTGLRSPTHYGRPNLDQIFTGLRHLHPATDIGVFFCGPKRLSTMLSDAANKYSQPEGGGTRFHFGKASSRFTPSIASKTLPTLLGQIKPAVIFCRTPVENLAAAAFQTLSSMNHPIPLKSTRKLLFSVTFAARDKTVSTSGTHHLEL